MNNQTPRQERILKIFTPVRCMNRDQLLRYQRGQMTAVEKHLVEQHMVDCDLCHHALMGLENPKNHEPYERLSQQLSLFIQREYAPPPKQQKQQIRPPRQVMSRESLLSYFWVIMFIVIGGGSVFLLQQHLKNRPAFPLLPARAAETLVIPPAAQPAAAITAAPPEEKKPAPVIQTHYGNRDSLQRRVAALSAKDSALLKKKTAKDTVRKSVPDSSSRVALKAPQPPVAKDTPKPRVEKLAVNTTPIQQDKEEKAPPKETVEKTEEETPKATPPPVSGEEAMYRVAMQLKQQGDVNGAINQLKKLSGNNRYEERVKYQLAILYRNKGQNGKARRLFKDVVKMDGNLKSQAQAELDNKN
ncbi:tetratricopeptide repeat protein [Chitinophaga alhagiae]|uniref:tetratricopeptide repeat protein n=1 Tax=Chitinophaga alhagiae TaxID=2203219 RepID=UPI000E5B2A58|nr:hypothetical protein [Chitinophaga alhagiae]